MKLALASFASSLFAGTAAAAVLAQLWDWFIVPVFALPDLNVFRAYGLLLVVSLFGVGRTVTHQLEQKEAGDEATMKSIVHSFCCVLLCLLILGWAFLFRLVAP